MQHTSKLPNVKTTIFTIMSALAKKHNAINLSQGFPDFNTDSKLIELVNKAMLSGANQYAPKAGLIELREAIANKMEFLYSTSYSPESEITVTVGATEAISCIISTFVKPNDEVIVFHPAYDCYEPMIELNGGKTVSIQLEAPFYKVDWTEVEQNISSKTKMIIINTPQNPSGTVFSKDDMLRLQELTKDTNIIVLSDEAYEHIIFDGEQHQSVCLFPDLKQRSFVVASFGKTFHSTGWRIGYCCASKDLMHEFRKVHQFTTFSASNPMQKALADYLKEPSHYLELPSFFQAKRDLLLDSIKGSKFTFIPSQGTYFQNLNYSAISDEQDVDFVKRLVEEFGIASIPLSEFNVDNRDYKTVRFCFAKTDDTIKRAAEILNRI